MAIRTGPGARVVPANLRHYQICQQHSYPFSGPKFNNVARSNRCKASGEDGRDATGLSSLRLAKPTEAEMQDLMTSWSRLQPHHLRLAPGRIPHQPLHGLFPCPLISRSCNHQHAGASLSAPDLPDDVSKGKFMITTARKQIGSGRKAYDAAIKAVKAWEHLQLGWNCTTQPTLREGATVCSATQTVVPWSVLPAKVSYCKEGAVQFSDGNKGRRFAVGMCSLTGHQLAGEERFAVEMRADGSVWYDVFLFSRPDTLLSLLSLPVVKLQQVRYVNDSVKAVQQAVQA